MIKITAELAVSPPDVSLQGLGVPFRLGPLDSLVTPTIPIAVVFVYTAARLQPGSETIICRQRLRQALESVLHHYPHLTGRLKVDHTGGSPFIEKIGTGASLILAECSRTLNSLSAEAQDLSLGDFPNGGNELLSTFDPSIDTIADQPILSIQHTRFACGAVALGIRILHTVCDAEGYFHFVQHLAETYRGRARGTGEGMAIPPCILPYLAGLDQAMSQAEREDTSSALYHLISEKPRAQAGSSSVSIEEDTRGDIDDIPKVSGQFMRFSSAELAAIKLEAADPAGKFWISTFDALSAHLYRHVHRARLAIRTIDPHFPSLSPPDFLTPVNIRTRLGPHAFPSNYFPNALITAVTEIPSDLLSSGPSWKIAKIIHDITRTPSITSATELEETVRWIAAQLDKRNIVQDFRFGGGVFMCSQWTRFDMYEGCRFDDAPVLVAPPFTPISLIDGLAYLLPISGSSAEVEVCLALSDGLWAHLEADLEFRRFRPLL